MADTATTRSTNVPKGPTEALSQTDPTGNTPERRESVMSDGFEKVEASSHQNEQEDGHSQATEEATVEGEDGDEASESVPAGTVDAEGNVVDGEGNILGKVNGDVPEGSTVDTEGDVLDAECNVIGTAEPIDDAAKEPEEAAGETPVGSEVNVEEPENVLGPEGDLHKQAEVSCL